MSATTVPTQAEVRAFIRRFLPVAAGAKEVLFEYQTPRHRSYSASRQTPERVVLSITPTKGFYEAISGPGSRQGTLCFLHRPWNLDRRSLPNGTLVLASHAAFDQSLTVGYNTALAERLDIDMPQAVCIQGYKDNPDRKIGLVGVFQSPTSLKDLVDAIRGQYDGIGELHGVKLEDAAERRIRVLAIMNAFHEEEIVRVLKTAHEMAWIDDEEDGNLILYLTGAARDYGLEAIGKYEMPAFCVGHRACEEWGIRYLAERLRQRWPNLDVREVLEEEEVIEKSDRDKSKNVSPDAKTPQEPSHA